MKEQAHELSFLVERIEVDSDPRPDASWPESMRSSGAKIDLAIICQSRIHNEYFGLCPGFVFEKPGNRFDCRAFVPLSPQWSGVGG